MAASSHERLETPPPRNAEAALQQEFTFLKYRPPHDQPSNPFDTLTVKHDAFWTYCGPLLQTETGTSSYSLPYNFEEFTSAVFAPGDKASDALLAALNPFLFFINSFLLESGLSHYLLTIRTIMPNHEFDKRRWHTDELFFGELNEDGGTKFPGRRSGFDVLMSAGDESEDSDGSIDVKESPASQEQGQGTNWKICTALLGPQTLFIPLDYQNLAREVQLQAQKTSSTPHSCVSIRCVGCATAADSVREKLDERFREIAPATAGDEECSFFRLGREVGAVHSEPCMSGEEVERGRVFVNVVPGREEELREMMWKWGMGVEEWPRAWWIGSGVVRNWGL